MIRRSRLWLALGMLLPALDVMGAGSRPTKPNFVFIITDDQRADYLGIAGHPSLKTPNIDRIGREGAWFKNFFVATPLCSPSRASFLTGLYPHKHRITNNDRLGLDVISFALSTWPRQLRETGYETGYFGKWHMGFDDSRRPGFDRWVSFKGQGFYVDPVVNEDGKQRQLTGYMTDYLNQQAVDFIRKDRETPFAMVLSHKAVHYSYLPAKRHDALYSDYEFAPTSLTPGDREGKLIFTTPPPKPAPIDMEVVLPEPQETRRGRGREPATIVRDQLRCLASVDEGVGQIFAALEATGKLDNTVIIFTSDNGYLMGEHGRFDDKRLAYEPSLRVPMLMRYPPLIAAGSVKEELVLNIDVAPTLLELAGVEPWDLMHGKSFATLFRDGSASWRDAFLAEYFLEKVVQSVPAWQCVRTDRHKYIRYIDRPESFDELYDLKTDPNETANLATIADHKPTLDGLRKRLGELLLETR